MKQTYIVPCMKYIGTDNFDHGQQPQVGVLLTNLGTPEAPDKRALRVYLKEFLSDPRVVEIPRLVWWFILNVIILNIRPARSAAAYRKIWTEQGSPLMVHTRDQACALQTVMKDRFGGKVTVDFAMRYGSPAIGDAVQRLLAQGVTNLLVLPLYPQYSGSTTGSTFDALTADLTRRRWVPDLRFVSHYHDHPAYITALADSIREYRKENGDADKLVLSYHGVPRSFLDKGDPYHCQCHKTSRLVAQQLGLSETDYLTTFQSRFGRAEWLQPYTDASLRRMPGEGITSVQVVCPGFSADCLETLEEIAVENRDCFLSAGGQHYEYIPCLNSEPGHIAALAELVTAEIGGWLQESPDSAGTKARAINMGAKQ
jgi:ferrochelatase